MLPKATLMQLKLKQDKTSVASSEQHPALGHHNMPVGSIHQQLSETRQQVCASTWGKVLTQFGKNYLTT